MLFNSVSFLVFFVLVVALYYVLPFRFRVVFILLASYYFCPSCRWTTAWNHGGRAKLC